MSKYLTLFLVGVLNLLQLFNGLELAIACKNMDAKIKAFVMLLVRIVSLVGSGGVSLGFWYEIIAHLLIKLRILVLCGIASICHGDI